ncbi:MAG TPA: bile acid:sodium symporter [Anaerolineales bacterium]|nr:bile acid:sodium symporter [Anaerolineales bacterium]
MTAAEFFAALATLSGLIFVVTSMLAMGMSLTIAQILQPLRNARLVILGLLANFVLVPGLAYLILRILPLDPSLQIGLILLSTAAGAPFLPKLVQVAKGNVAFGVGLMVLLMTVTIVYVPIVLPLLLPGVEANPWDIAKSLIVVMLVPLVFGLLVRSGAPETADHYQPLMNKTSSLAILALTVLGLGLNLSSILDLIGSLGILALLLFVFVAFGLGFVLGGPEPGTRSVLGLGTAQRNISAAIVVGAQNFASDPGVLTFILVAAIVSLLVLMPLAKRLGAERG